MPLVSAAGSSPNWGSLYEVANLQSGYFSTKQAGLAGYSPQLLVYYLRQGKVRRAGRGLWRLVHYPTSEHEELIPLWLWSEQKGVFSHETALLLHDLSDVLPDHTHLTLPLSWERRRLQTPPRTFLVYADFTPEERGWHGPIPVTSVARTLRDCLRAHLPPDLLQQAIEQGLRRGLLREEQGQALLREVQEHQQP